MTTEHTPQDVNEGTGGPSRSTAGLGVLRPHEREVYDYLDGLRVLELTQQTGQYWARPMDVGGYDGSHHSRTLAKLVKLGLAERRQRGALCAIRGSWEYRALETPNVEAQGRLTAASLPAGVPLERRVGGIGA